MDILLSHSSHPSPQQTDRRNARHNNHREFACPCGKSYLSYPALFTHVKHKHQGKPPGELIKPASMTNLRRGRPKGTKNGESEEQKKRQKELALYQATGDVEIQFMCFLIKIASDLNNDLIKRCYRFNLCDRYLNIQNRYGNKKVPSCEEVFCRLLQEVGFKIGRTNNIIHALLLLLCYFSSHIDQKVLEFEGRENFTQWGQPLEMGYFANSFITDSVMRTVQEEGLSGCDFFREVNIVKTLEFVFQWLSSKNYTLHYLLIRPEVGKQ